MFATVYQCQEDLWEPQALMTCCLVLLTVPVFWKDFSKRRCYHIEKCYFRFLKTSSSSHFFLSCLASNCRMSHVLSAILKQILLLFFGPRLWPMLYLLVRKPIQTSGKRLPRNNEVVQKYNQEHILPTYFHTLTIFKQWTQILKTVLTPVLSSSIAVL